MGFFSIVKSTESEDIWSWLNVLIIEYPRLTLPL